MFKKYVDEVYPAKLVFVSFLRQHSDGEMVTALKKIGLDHLVLQYVFDVNRPDLSKLDSLFGLLSSQSNSFDEEVAEEETSLAEDICSQSVEALKVST